jgi:hypothetical protein
MFGSGRVGRLFGDRTLTVGFFGVWGCTAALVLQVPLLHRPDDGFWLVPLVALSGFGFGMVTPRLLSFALGAVESAEAGAASGALSSVQTISRGLGIAAIGSLFLAVAAVAGGVPQYLRQAAPAVASCVSAALSKGDGASARAVCPAAPRHGPHPAVASAVNGVVHHAFSAAYTASLLTMAALFLVSLALARRCGALTNGVRR